MRARSATVDSLNLRTVKEVWDAFDHDGFEAGLDALLAASSEDVELRPYTGHGTVLRGSARLRDFWRGVTERGDSIRAGAYEFLEQHDDVVVTGWLRVSRAGGGLSDSQVRWTFTLRDARIVRVVAEPLTSA